MIALSFGVAVFAYLASGVLLARGWRGERQGLLLLATVATTGAWACAGLAAALAGNSTNPWLEVGNSLRAIAWIWLLLGMLTLVREARVTLAARHRPIFQAAWVLAALKLMAAGSATLSSSTDFIAQLDRAGGLALAVLGLLLVENIYSAIDRNARWAFKHLLIAAGFVFAFDLFRYSDALLVHRFDGIALAGQALLTAMVAPLLIVTASRVRQFAIVIHVARRFVLQTSALVFSGCYLLAVALVGYLLRHLDLGWGPLLQFGSLAGALLLLALLLSSGTARARGRRLVERSFFNFAYDYREEWRRFVATMAGDAANAERLRERAIRAVAEPLDCSAGLLYARDEAGRWRCAAAWNWRAALDGPPPPDPVLQALEAGTQAMVDLRDPEAVGVASQWRSRPADAWLLLGLRCRDRSEGVLLLGRPRVHRSLTWEDRDLLQILASQVAGYLAEDRATRSLADSARFEATARSFSFVAHDLKNIVTQLSVMLQQAKRHGDRPEFLQDTLLTLGDSVDRMQALLLRLRDGSPIEQPRPVELTQFLRNLLQAREWNGWPLDLHLPTEPTTVRAEPGALATILRNLLDNARQAGGDQIRIQLRVTSSNGTAVIEVADDGPGMSREFIEESLFRPFASTKPQGFGIGLYQCREWAGRWGGSLDVSSTPGLGTTVRLSLAALPHANDEKRLHGEAGPVELVDA
jgi:putative PEP-CTERM system histidine kinase